MFVAMLVAPDAPLSHAPIDAASQFVVSAIIVYLLQLVKKWKAVPWIAADTVKVNRWIAVAASFLAAIGIHTTFNSEAGVLTITGLTLTSIVTFAWTWVRGFVMQELTYQMTANRLPMNGNGAPPAPATKP